MKETIVIVRMPPAAKKISPNVWKKSALIATLGNPQWKPIFTKDEFVLTSDVGTFILSTTNFASGMMCSLNKWKRKYKKSFEDVVKSIALKAQIKGIEVTV